MSDFCKIKVKQDKIIQKLSHRDAEEQVISNICTFLLQGATQNEIEGELKSKIAAEFQNTVTCSISNNCCFLILLPDDSEDVSQIIERANENISAFNSFGLNSNTRRQKHNDT